MGAVCDGPVDGAADGWRQRDPDDLGAFAAYAQYPVAHKWLLAHPRVRLHFTPAYLLLDQPGRAVVRRTAAPVPGPRRVLFARRAHHRAGGLDQDLERQRSALQVDQDRRPDHRPDLPLLLTHLRTGTLGDGEHCADARSGIPGGLRVPRPASGVYAPLPDAWHPPEGLFASAAAAAAAAYALGPGTQS